MKGYMAQSIKCLVATNDLTDKSQILIVEGLEKQDVPAAIGYFVMNMLMESYRAARKMPCAPTLNIMVADVEASVIQANRNAVRKYNLTGAEYGEIFNMVRAVECGDQGGE